MHAAQSFAVTEAYRGMRLDRFLQRMMPRMSRASIQQAIATRVHLRSGAEPKASRRPAVGDVVTIAARPRGDTAHVIVPVLVAGRGWTVVDKPAGVASTPGSRRPGPDIVTMLGQAPAHRLDRGTSGCLLLTSDPFTARCFDLAFRARRVAKSYLAVVLGTPACSVFDIDAPIGPDLQSRVPRKMAVLASGVPAATHVEVLARAGDRCLVRAVPLTGRRHQIRVHLAHTGHAIVGDLLYGGDERRFIRHQMGQPVDTAPGLAAGRHLLHAHRLAFDDPASGQRIEVEAPWPADFGFAPAAGQPRATSWDRS
ncbi:MAG TPA: RluA family pseudouridine synthase [Planctomycetota bacterium]|nr:RluA family pseudouridine synthase [Planctomycetota bacterium]